VTKKTSRIGFILFCEDVLIDRTWVICLSFFCARWTLKNFLLIKKVWLAWGSVPLIISGAKTLHDLDILYQHLWKLKLFSFFILTDYSLNMFKVSPLKSFLFQSYCLLYFSLLIIVLFMPQKYIVFFCCAVIITDRRHTMNKIVLYIFYSNKKEKERLERFFFVYF
jgi:IS4 transposase